jgi:anti-sigma regulatory factor (Ser/Thr protein kinase)
MTMTVIRSRATGHPGYSETHLRTEQAASLARGLVRTACATWGLTDETAEAAALVMAALFSNAVRHACGSSVRVVVDRPGDDRVYVAVIDRSPHQLPEPRTPDPDEQSGRGLLLIEALSDRWGYDRLGPASRPWGKRCWAELRAKDSE